MGTRHVDQEPRYDKIIYVIRYVIDEFDGEFVISDTGGLGRCATYSTKEKALKVLDEINSLLDASEFDVSNLPIVFEMPLDDEVEV